MIFYKIVRICILSKKLCPKVLWFLNGIHLKIKSNKFTKIANKIIVERLLIIYLSLQRRILKTLVFQSAQLMDKDWITETTRLCSQFNLAASQLHMPLLWKIWAQKLSTNMWVMNQVELLSMQSVWIKRVYLIILWSTQEPSWHVLWSSRNVMKQENSTIF